MAVTGQADASNVISAKPLSVVGGLFVAALGSDTKITGVLEPGGTLPTGLSLEALGYITEDGITRTVSNDAEKIKAWGGDVILTTYAGAEAELEVPVAEYLNPVAHKQLYGESNVTVTPATSTKGTTIEIHAALNSLPPHVCLVACIASDGAKGTIVYPDAQAVLDGDVEMNGTDVTALPLKFSLRPVNGDFYREYWEKNDKLAAGS